uniref:Uncharacterized protein n=1 Tax=Arundo donax TaxID=35708 RepID=A0A0A9AB86_ARUDO
MYSKCDCTVEACFVSGVAGKRGGFLDQLDWSLLSERTYWRGHGVVSGDGGFRFAAR